MGCNFAVTKRSPVRIVAGISFKEKKTYQKEPSRLCYSARNEENTLKGMIKKIGDKWISWRVDIEKEMTMSDLQYRDLTRKNADH